MKAEQVSAQQPACRDLLLEYGWIVVAGVGAVVMLVAFAVLIMLHGNK